MPFHAYACVCSRRFSVVSNGLLPPPQQPTTKQKSWLGSSSLSWLQNVQSEAAEHERGSSSQNAAATRDHQEERGGAAPGRAAPGRRRHGRPRPPTLDAIKPRRKQGSEICIQIHTQIQPKCSLARCRPNTPKYRQIHDVAVFECEYICEAVWCRDSTGWFLPVMSQKTPHCHCCSTRCATLSYLLQTVLPCGDGNGVARVPGW